MKNIPTPAYIQTNFAANYYKSEFKAIKTESEYSPTIRINDSEGNKTKYLTLNKECAQELVKWLEDNFING